MTTSTLLAVLAAYGILVGVLSGVSFAAYGIDKHRAGRASRRISERTLHLLALAGGWPGAYLGQQFFRHKTQKKSFRIVFWLTLVLHVGVVAAIAYGCMRSSLMPSEGALAPRRTSLIKG